jgi:Domain of unknown function (DUF1992)
MTERKPPGISFETWVDKQIREATERGEFDNLPGAGKPLRGYGQPDDELWWVKDLVRREGLSTEALLPTPLRLRKEVERLPSTVGGLRSEQAVREVVDDLNRRIMDWLRIPSGPQVHLVPVNVDEVVEQWRATHETPAAATPDDPVTTEAAPPWWRRVLKELGHSK